MSRLYRPNPGPRSPGGLFLPLHAKLSGRVRWQTLDERLVPEVPRSPSGVPVAPIEGGEQSNLITDAGLDALATVSCHTLTPNGWRSRFHVGTGSTEPDVTDTALDAEVQSSETYSPYAYGSASGSYDSGTEVITADLLITRIIQMSANHNLTEFGLSPNGLTDLAIRELFRDGVGDPVTVSLLNGKYIKLDHTLRIELPAPTAGASATIDVEEYDAANSLVATTPYDVIYGPVLPSGYDSSDIVGTHFALVGSYSYSTMSILHLWNPAFSNASVGLARVENAKAYNPVNGVASTYSSGDFDPSSTSLLDDAANETYVSGSYERIKRATVSTGDANGAWEGAFIGDKRSKSKYAFWLMLFDSPATYTKESTDTLRVGIKQTWARATEGSGS